MTPRESYEVRTALLETILQLDYSEKSFELVGTIMQNTPDRDSKDELAKQFIIMMNGMSEKAFQNELEGMLKG